MPESDHKFIRSRLPFKKNVPTTAPAVLAVSDTEGTHSASSPNERSPLVSSSSQGSLRAEKLTNEFV